jgi:hypothetical protein
VGDTIGWGIIVPKSEEGKIENKLVICLHLQSKNNLHKKL